MDFFGFSRGKKRKSQVSAPIELLIAVVVMSMSLAIAFYLNDVMACSRCLDEQKGEGQRLADAMHSVSLGFSGTRQSTDYTMRSCCGSKVDGVRFARYTSREFCGKCLGSFGSGCWKIEPVGYDRDGNLAPFADASVCVDMSESLEVDSGTCSGNAENLLESPCPGITDASDCKAKAFLQRCSDNSWGYDEAGGCSSGTPGLAGVARFKTLERKEDAYSFDVNLTKTSIAGGKVGLQVCAVPR